MTAAAVEVFCRAGCGRCVGLRRWLSAVGVPVVFHDVLTDPVAARRVGEPGFTSLPVTPGGHAATGADPQALSAALPTLAAAARRRAPEEEAAR